MQDPNDQDYRVLVSDRSTKIASRLGYTKLAWEEERCLACHATPQAADSKAPLPSEWAFGVGCEACHGPAQEWLNPHTVSSGLDSWANVKAMARKERGPGGVEERFGLKDLNNLAVRAEVCAGCHVGAPADPSRGIPLRDMNHDMIAAGHPRLNFEMSSYLANLPKHWVETEWDEKEKKQVPIETAEQRQRFEARVWSAGQVQSLAAALGLLADRAGDEKRPWPEFADYDCYACHHDLWFGTKELSWRQQRGYPGRAPGVVPWSDWYREMPLLLAERDGKAGRKDVATGLKALAGGMNKPIPSRGKAGQQAQTLAGQLRPWAADLAAARWEENTIKSLREEIVRHSENQGLNNWDAATQSCLALAALQAEIKGLLRELIDKLALPRGLASPSQFRQKTSAEQFRGLFKADD